MRGAPCFDPFVLSLEPRGGDAHHAEHAWPLRRPMPIRSAAWKETKERDERPKTIHVFSARDRAEIPDLAPLGLPPARGEYRWTVRTFPDWAYVEQLTGLANRLYRSSSTSAPRTVVLP